jgi:hypothetical protein
MAKGLFPPAPVGNAPSQFGWGTQTNCSNEKGDNLVENPSLLLLHLLFFSITSLSKVQFLKK